MGVQECRIVNSPEVVKILSFVHYHRRSMSTSDFEDIHAYVYQWANASVTTRISFEELWQIVKALIVFPMSEIKISCSFCQT